MQRFPKPRVAGSMGSHELGISAVVPQGSSPPLRTWIASEAIHQAAEPVARPVGVANARRTSRAISRSSRAITTRTLARSPSGPIWRSPAPWPVPVVEGEPRTQCRKVLLGQFVPPWVRAGGEESNPGPPPYHGQVTDYDLRVFQLRPSRGVPRAFRLVAISKVSLHPSDIGRNA
jgi:hypothetical protein